MKKDEPVTHKHEDALAILTVELNRLGGIVFARYLVTYNAEGKKTVETMEFMKSLMEGKIEKDKEDFLRPYLEPMWKINAAMQLLIKDK